MIDDDDANNPLVVYLNVPADDEFKGARQDSVVAYLKEQGLEEKQVSFKEGVNPGTNHPAQDGLTRLAKTETGLAGDCCRQWRGARRNRSRVVSDASGSTSK